MKSLKRKKYKLRNNNLAVIARTIKLIETIL